MSTKSDPKERTRAAVAKEFGIPERKLRAMQEISKHSPDAVADIRDGKKTIKEAIGEIKLAGAKERYAESRKHGTPPIIVRADALEWAAHEVLVPVVAHVLSLAGLKQLLQAVELTRQQLNPGLKVAGLLACRVNRTRHVRAIQEELRGSIRGRPVR